VKDYVDARRNWLATHPRQDLRLTVYRMDAFIRLIALDAWGLELPLVVRGAEISDVTLAGVPPDAFSGPQPGTRDLTLQTPLFRGLDVRLLQLALSERGADIRADGVFGRASSDRVADHQRANGLPVTGAADTGLVAALAAEVS
jgi:chitosanase